MANRYIHGSLLSGENNGEDWANAYQINDLSQIPWSEIDDGDEIFIHGDGVLHYVLTNPLIYGKDVRIRCGQETGHNGQVIIDGNGLELDEVVQMDSNCSLYGFGSTHYDYYITPRGTTREISCGIRITNVKGCGINIPTETDWEVSYVQVDNIGWIDDIVVESYHGIKCRNAQGGSIHHCHIFHCGGDGVNSSGSRADNWGSNEFYYNVVHNVNDDGIAGKAGWDVHRNIIGYCSVQKGINTEHPDGMQLQGNWTRVWFNEVFNVANCCIFLDPVKGSSGFDGLGDMDGYRHVRVHNNLLYQTEESLDPPRIISRGIQLRGDGEPDQKIVDDIYVFSNDAVDFSRHGAFVDTSDSTLITTYNVVWRNNLIHNCETYQMFASGSEMDPAYGQPDMDYDYVGTDGTNGYNTMQWGNVNYSWADFVSNGFGEDNGTDVAPTFVDHAFRDTDHYDLHLDPSSPSCLTDGVDMLTEFPVLASTCPDADKDFDEVLRPVGTGWSKGCFQVLTGAAPEIDSIDPGEGGVAGGTTCTITGSNFTSSRGTEVRFDGTLASNIVVVNPTTITCNSPAHAAGAVDVQVSTSSGSDTLTDGFIYYGAPTITDVDPDNGTKNGGTSVTITGTNFTAVGQTVIVFGGVKATGVLVVSSTTIVCTTPAHAAGTVNVVLLNAYGSDTLTDGYTFNEEEKGWGINTGTAATAGWAHLDAVEEVDKPVPISLAHDFRGPSTFVWEMRHGKHWDVPNHQKVTFEYPAGTVRFRGRFKISKGEGTPGSQGYRFDCVGMRGLARNVPVVDSAADGYPELIYNADPTDVDYHRSVFNTDGSDMTVGEIIKDLFDRFKTALDGEDATISGSAAYTQSGLDSLSAVPGKVTFLETGFEAAVMQVLAVQGVTWSIWVDMSVGM